MNRLPLASLALSLCTPIFAQSHITSPKDQLTKEGGSSTWYFGSWSDARWQQVDATHVGSNGQTIERIDFRLDNQYYRSGYGTGRTWSNIRLQVSETDFTNLSATFSRNIVGKEATVFDSAWTWPTHVGNPVLRPATWGGAGSRLSFPFRTPWVYSGKNAILMDFRFSGGALENKAPWTFETRVFVLDGMPTHGASFASPLLLPSTLNHCGDVGLNTGQTATTWLHATARTNDLSSQLQAYWTAPNAAVLCAVGLGGNNTGVDIGARCQRLYVDFNRPTVLLAMSTNAGGIFMRNLGMPWQPWLADLELYAQTAWTDSKTGAFSLTVASKTTLPNGPPSTLPKLRSIFTQNVSSGVGDFDPYVDDLLFPIVRYTVR